MEAWEGTEPIATTLICVCMCACVYVCVCFLFFSFFLSAPTRNTPPLFLHIFQPFTQEKLAASPPSSQPLPAPHMAAPATVEVVVVDSNKDRPPTPAPLTQEEVAQLLDALKNLPKCFEAQGQPGKVHKARCRCCCFFFFFFFFSNSISLLLFLNTIESQMIK
jgi:hypothetical protein